MQSGFRSVLTFFVGGGAKPLSTGTYAGPRSILAYWLGGGNWHYLPPVVIPPSFAASDLTGGLPYAKRHPGRYANDDQEIIEFLQWWTLWNDVE